MTEKEGADAAAVRKRQSRAASPGAAVASKATDGEGKAKHAEEQNPIQRQKSVYSMTPHKMWLPGEREFSFGFFGAVAFAVMAMCCLLTPSFETLRLAYTVVASAGILWRVQYYYKKMWLLFFIDLCYFASFVLLASLWICPGGGCSAEWMLAVNIVAQGAVAGAVFPLQTPLLLHHPEAFESFFLHNSPMWVCYAIRWRFFQLDYMPGLGQLVWLAFSKVYLPWFVAYWTFLMLQPFLPDLIAGSEVLPDGFIYPDYTREARMKDKRENYKSWVKNASIGLFAHMVMSCSGFLAAAMTYHYHPVQVVWILCVLAGCADTARVFYERSADPTIPATGLKKGLMRMAGAWAAITPVYLACKWFGVAAV